MWFLILFLLLIIVLLCRMLFNEKKRKEDYRKFAYKHLQMVEIFDEWVELKQLGVCMADWLIKHGYKVIAIYGMGYLGKRLMEELHDSPIQVKYGVDRAAATMTIDMDVFTLEDDLLPVDAVVVTVTGNHKEIQKAIQMKMGCPVILLKEIIEHA